MSDDEFNNISINDDVKVDKYTPSPRAHLVISIVKSLFRICAGIAICLGGLISGGLLLIAAELLGILEELV